MSERIILSHRPAARPHRRHDSSGKTRSEQRNRRQHQPAAAKTGSSSRRPEWRRKECIPKTSSVWIWRVPRGRRDPSSEWRFHRDIYAARTEVNAIVHGHPPFCVALAVLHKAIPPYHYMVARQGEQHPLRSYATFGTQELSNHAMRPWRDARPACWPTTE